MPRVDPRSGPSAAPAPKRQRVTRACDLCHKKGNKCSPSDREGVCEPCRISNVSCTYNRPVKRRGPAPGTAVPRPRSPPLSSPKINHNHIDREPWRPAEIADHEAIEGLVACYHDIVFPIFCFFHWPTFVRKVKEKLYLSDRAFYATVMVVCAVSSARVRDGATLSLASVPHTTTAQSEEFYRAAESALPTDLSQVDNFEYIRATALLAITALQYGEMTLMNVYLGNFHTLFAFDGRHDEKRWDPTLSRIDVEERRRLFWSIYTLEVYAGVVWGGIVRCREAQSLISFPIEVDDEYITDTTMDSSAQPPGTLSWVQGWNFTTDLYRLLEHALDHNRNARAFVSSMSPLLNQIKGEAPPPEDLLKSVGECYEEIHPRFKEVRPVSFNAREDRFSFQSANIIVAMQTVRMVVLGRDGALSVDRRCSVARQLLGAIRLVPTAYLQSISSPLLHHLAGIGNLLGEAISGAISQEAFFQVRDVLLLMADLLASLESKLRFAAGASHRLKAHVQRIDDFLTSVTADRPGGAKADGSEGSTHSAPDSGLSRSSQPAWEPIRETPFPTPRDGQDGHGRSMIKVEEMQSPLNNRRDQIPLQRHYSGQQVDPHEVDGYRQFQSPAQQNPPAQHNPPVPHHQPQSSPNMLVSHHQRSPPSHAHHQSAHHGMQAPHGQGQGQIHHLPDPPAPPPGFNVTSDNRYHSEGPMVPEAAGGPFPPGDPRSWQFRLPDELLSEWPFDLGQGLIFPDSLTAQWHFE